MRLLPWWPSRSTDTAPSPTRAASRRSVRLSSSNNLPKIAAARKTEPARLSTLVRGEIDWIVMKCLEKDRARRYDTASGLARDVERYLADEPVEACPPSARGLYRLAPRPMILPGRSEPRDKEAEFSWTPCRMGPTRTRFGSAQRRRGHFSSSSRTSVRLGNTRPFEGLPHNHSVSFPLLLRVRKIPLFLIDGRFQLVLRST